MTITTGSDHPSAGRAFEQRTHQFVIPWIVSFTIENHLHDPGGVLVNAQAMSRLLWYADHIAACRPDFAFSDLKSTGSG